MFWSRRETRAMMIGLAADILAERIQKTYADAEGDVALIIISLPGVAGLDQRAQRFREQIAAIWRLEYRRREGSRRPRDKINLVGFDWDEELVKFLQDDTIAALVVQDRSVWVTMPSKPRSPPRRVNRCRP